MKRLIPAVLAAFIGIASAVCGTNLIKGDNAVTENTLSAADSDNLKVYFLDVGQGDSIFVMLPNGKNMLIDAGEKKNGGEIASFIKEKGVSKIDFLVATHPHADHIGGMAEIAENFELDKIYMPKASANTKTFEKLLLTIKEKGKTVTAAKAGVSVLSEDGLDIHFVAPNSDKYDDLNDYSAVIKLTYGKSSFLFTGDAEKLSEKEISADIKCDVLKVAHHGSNSSSSEDFIMRASPKYAVISCGANNEYGHPHDEVTSLLEKSGIEIFRTDRQGTIEAISDGEKIEFNFEYDY